MKGLRVLKTGPLSLLQDGGRRGWQHLGVSPAGPLDIQAASWANHLLSNPWGTPLLEVALGGLVLECEIKATWLAVTGASLPVLLDGQAQWPWSRFRVRRGQRLELGFARSGQRAYLACVGGFRAPAVLGSIAVQQCEGLGGLRGDGTALAQGDYLPCTAVSAACHRACSVPWQFQPDYRQELCLRVILNSDAPHFDIAAREAFFRQTWRLSPHSNRMGARLRGEALIAPQKQWSQGVVGGAIQVPPDGQPIILLADRQSMGGYPLLGFVHPLDLPWLAQCPAHGALRFVETDLHTAQAELLRFYRFFRG